MVPRRAEKNCLSCSVNYSIPVESGARRGGEGWVGLEGGESFGRFDPCGYFKGGFRFERRERVALFPLCPRTTASISFSFLFFLPLFFHNASGLLLFNCLWGLVRSSPSSLRERAVLWMRRSKVFPWVTRRASRNKFLPSVSASPALNHGNGLFNRRETTLGYSLWKLWKREREKVLTRFISFSSPFLIHVENFQKRGDPYHPCPLTQSNFRIERDLFSTRYDSSSYEKQGTRGWGGCSW